MYYITYKQRHNKATKKISSINELEQLISNFVDTKGTKAPSQNKTIKKPTTELTEELTKKLARLTVMIKRNIHKYGDKADHFSVFQIPKSSGGYRTITAPSEELKHEYTVIKNYLIDELKILTHNNAWAYTEKRSTLDAVKQHQDNNSNYFLKIDIEKFFDNCTPQLIIKQLSKIHPLHHAKNLIDYMAEFATFNNQLPQGTPLSPLLTNILMIPFDHAFSGYCDVNNLIYTRYADDIIISSKNSFSFKNILNVINKLLKENGYEFKIKNEKTRYGSKNGRNWNLGLMLNKDNQITLGHRYKKSLKVILNQLNYEALPYQDPHLMGLFAYLKQIEPNYFTHLDSYCLRKYDKSIKELVG